MWSTKRFIEKELSAVTQLGAALCKCMRANEIKVRFVSAAWPCDPRGEKQKHSRSNLCECAAFTDKFMHTRITQKGEVKERVPLRASI
jgi:hypothetical protein